MMVTTTLVMMMMKMMMKRFMLTSLQRHGSAHDGKHEHGYGGHGHEDE